MLEEVDPMSLDVSCSVNVSGEDISVNSLEKAALEGAREAGRRLLQALFGLIERTIAKVRRCECGRRVEKKLMTLVGEMSFSRKKQRCLSCGRESLPLDEAIGLRPRGRVMIGVREKALWLATEMVYDQASLGLRKLGRIGLSDETIKHLGRRKAERR